MNLKIKCKRIKSIKGNGSGIGYPHPTTLEIDLEDIENGKEILTALIESGYLEHTNRRAIRMLKEDYTPEGIDRVVSFLSGNI
jgi:hypothetical protein